MKDNLSYRIEKLTAKFPSPSNWKFWVVLALLIKAGIFTFKILEPGPQELHYPGTFASFAGDSPSYIDPIEHLLANGSYADDYRMPGYGWIYYLIRLLFSQAAALNVLVLLQLVLSAVSVYALALIAYCVFRHLSYFYLSFFIYLISTYASLFDFKLLTESFCTSSIIFSTYFLLTGSEKKSKLFFSGLFLTWAIFLKPVLAPVLIIFSSYLFLKNKIDKRYFAGWGKVFIFVIPFIILDGIWIIRNYKNYSKILPLTKTVYYPSLEESYMSSLFRFMNAFGGSIVYWEPGNDITFFYPASQAMKTETTLPATIYTSKFNLDSLRIIKNEIQEVENEQLPAEKREILNQKIKYQLDSYTASIKEEHPFLYHVSSRFRVAKKFFIHSGTYNLFNKASFELSSMEFLVKLFYSVLYLFVILFGFTGNLFMLIKEFKKTDYCLLVITGLYFALVFPFALKLDEYRYFVIAYPFFVLASTYAMVKGYGFIFKKNK